MQPRGYPGGGTTSIGAVRDISVPVEAPLRSFMLENFAIFPEFFLAGHLSTADFVGRLSISDFDV